MASNKLTFQGKEYGWKPGEETGDKLVSASGYIGDSLPAVELAVDTMTAVVQDYDTQPRLLAADGLLLTCEGNPLMSRLSDVRLDQKTNYGDPVFYHHNDGLVGKFYQESVVRLGEYEYQINALSAVGLLLTSYHYGGLYNGETMAEVLADIVGGVVPYTLDETLGKTKVYGLLRKAIRRDNLRDLLFATGGQIRKDKVGELHIVPANVGTPYELQGDLFYMGGSVTGGNPATAVHLTEHAFFALESDLLVTLYDGETVAEELVTPKGKAVVGTLVDFPEPMHDLSVSGAEILEIGPNYAVLSPSSVAVLTGKQYTHTTRTVSRQKQTKTTPNVVNSYRCELVSQFNSESVADRLWAYYGNAKTIQSAIVVDGQKPGDAVTFVDPFGDKTNGYIANMELTMSATLKGQVTLVSGYIPPISGNYYEHVMVITQSQTVTIPEEVKGKIRAVLVSGGHGGNSGYPGEQGEIGPVKSITVPVEYNGGDVYKYENQQFSFPHNITDGGQPGSPGVGARIKQITLAATAGQKFSAVIGKGGTGGLFSAGPNAPGSPGGDTTFGDYSTAEENASTTGYYDPVSGVIYGAPGGPGIPGGRGGGSKEGSAVEIHPTFGLQLPDDFEVEAEDVTAFGLTFHGGKTLGISTSKSDTADNVRASASGGYGGGAAYGANGEDASEGSARVSQSSYQNPYAQATGGVGGNGATAKKPPTPKTPGTGGYGGNGGGGSGAGGAATAYVIYKKGESPQYDLMTYSPKSEPGNGSDGGDGQDGIILIYY